jgi:hypothetical protein
VDSESVNIAITSALASLKNSVKQFENRETPDNLLALSREDLLIDPEEIELIIRQSFLYQTRPLDERTEITREIVKVIDGAIDRLENEV